MLCAKEAAAAARNDADHIQHQNNRQHHEQSQWDTDGEHSDKDRTKGYRRHHQVWNTLGDHLAQRIRIVGKVTHDVAI